MNKYALAAALLLATAQPFAAPAAKAQAPDSNEYSYSDTADILTRAPVVAHITIVKTFRLRGDLAVGVPAGIDRHLVTAKVVSLLHGADGITERISYLIDVPANQVFKPKKQQMLVALTLDRARPGMARLVSSRAQMRWSPQLDQRARAILTESLAPGAPPAVIGVANAFHVPGSLPGESETQIFLRTSNESPVSLNVLRRPGEAPRWAVALGEMVDDAAAPPAPETLLWYRLACGLPEALPDAATSALSRADAEAAARDYAFVIERLGPCGRAPR